MFSTEFRGPHMMVPKRYVIVLEGVLCQVGFVNLSIVLLKNPVRTTQAHEGCPLQHFHIAPVEPEAPFFHWSMKHPRPWWSPFCFAALKYIILVMTKAIKTFGPTTQFCGGRRRCHLIAPGINLISGSPVSWWTMIQIIWFSTGERFWGRKVEFLVPTPRTEN